VAVGASLAISALSDIPFDGRMVKLELDVG